MCDAWERISVGKKKREGADAEEKKLRRVTALQQGTCCTRRRLGKRRFRKSLLHNKVSA